MADKARLRRKDLKQPDEFITLSGQAVRWAQQHRQTATWVGAGALAILVGAGIFTAYRSATQRDANADLARALAKMSSGQFASASADHKQVSNRWDDTTIGPLAALMAANAALRAGEADAAIAELTRVQPRSKDLPPYLQQQMLIAWGAAFEDKGQWPEAAEKYRAAAALGGPYTAEAIVGEAHSRERAGDVDAARQLYRQAYDQFPDLPERDVINAKLPAE